MKKFKSWLINEFLPMWAKSTVQAENEKLKRKNADLEMRLAQANSYIDGLETAMTSRTKVVINNGGDKH